MKTLILFLALILPNLTQANPGLEKRWSKTSFIADGSFTIKVFVNGRSLNSRPQSQVEALRLTPGTHRVRIVAYGPRRTKELRDVVQVRQNSSNQFAVKSASRNGGIYLDPIRLSNRVPARRGRLHDKRRRVREDFCEEAKYFNVDRLVDQMNCERFDSRKLLLAKDAIAYGQVFADDLKYLMEQLAYDHSRVELAASAYTNVCNTRDFHHVFDALDYRSSIGKLKRLTGYY